VWKIKGTDIVWDEAQPKSADRPHWITTITSASSTFVGLAALIISVNSFRVSQESLKNSRRSAEISEQSMRVGQRAYVVIENGELEARMDPSETPNGDRTKGIVEFRCQMHNLGNTPARAQMMRILYQLPDGWTVTSPGLFVLGDNKYLDDLGGGISLGPKAVSTIENGIHVKLTKDALWRYENRKGSNDLRIEGKLYFMTVFNEQNQIRWCWSHDSEDSIFSSVPHNCRNIYNDAVDGGISSFPLTK
jgi:hypothetical protein